MSELLHLPAVAFVPAPGGTPAALANEATAWRAPAASFAAAESEQEQVDRLIATGGAAVAALALRLSRGLITKRQFIAEAADTLHAHALTAAELAGSETAMRPAVDALIADRTEYLDNFADDIQAGDLTGKAVAARAALWGGLMHTAWQLARTQATQDQAGDGDRIEITWVCKDDRNSCDDCPALADGSPYTPDTLPTHPGEDVQCSGNCRCVLEYDVVPAGGSDSSDDEESDFSSFSGFSGPAYALGGVQ